MPIEVKELVIKAVVQSEEESTTESIDKQPASEKDVTDGLEKLLELIKNKNER